MQNTTSGKMFVSKRPEVRG